MHLEHSARFCSPDPSGARPVDWHPALLQADLDAVRATAAAHADALAASSRALHERERERNKVAAELAALHAQVEALKAHAAGMAGTERELRLQLQAQEGISQVRVLAQLCVGGFFVGVGELALVWVHAHLLELHCVCGAGWAASEAHAPCASCTAAPGQLLLLLLLLLPALLPVSIPFPTTPRYCSPLGRVLGGLNGVPWDAQGPSCSPVYQHQT